MNYIFDKLSADDTIEAGKLIPEQIRNVGESYECVPDLSTIKRKID